MKNGYIYGINGPVVAVKGTDELKMMEMVKVGKDKLIGEVIGLESDRAIVPVSYTHLTLPTKAFV